VILAILAAILVGVTGVFLVLGVWRVASGSQRTKDFIISINEITDSELESDREEKIVAEPKSWSGYWLKLYINTGRIPVNAEAPGRLPIILALISFGVGFLVWPGDPVAGFVFSLLSLAAVRMYYIFEANRRTKTLEKQLPLLISGMRANLQANQTAPAAIMAVAEEIPSPLGDELKILRNDMQLNVELTEALGRLSERVPSREIKFLVSAINIAVKAGTDLDPQLVIIQDVVDKRTRLRQRLASALAEVQPALLVSGIMIPAALVFNFYSDPANKAFWFSFNGLIALGIVGFLYATGLFISKKLVEGVEKT
jgi:Flp pilus assembly protein TadB